MIGPFILMAVGAFIAIGAGIAGFSNVTSSFSKGGDAFSSFDTTFKRHGKIAGVGSFGGLVGFIGFLWLVYELLNNAGLI